MIDIRWLETCGGEPNNDKNI